MAARKTGNPFVDSLATALVGIAGRALGAAAESVLEDVSDRLRNVDEKVSRTKRKVAGVRKSKRRTPEVIEAEIVDDERKH